MTVHAYARGNKIVYNDELDLWVYGIDGSPLPKNPAHERSCKRCGRVPTPEGYDACLGHIEGAIAACCGHGVEDDCLLYQDNSGGELS